MTVRFYSSSDASAPVLRGNTPGDLINLLTKCLIDGYGSKTGAGWTKPYTGTNIAAFRQGAGSNGMYLRVDDTSTATGWRSARVVGYETMSDVNTGAPVSFPQPDWFAGGAHWWTHAGSGSVANPRAWFVVADEMFFWLFINTYPENGDSSMYYNEQYCFGDIIPFKPGDSTHTVLFACERTSGVTSESVMVGNSISESTSAANYRLSVARSYSQFGGPLRVGWHADHVKGSASWGQGNLSFPHAVDGGLYLSPVWVHEPNLSPYNVRGLMPGLWVPCHYNGILSQRQVFEGQGDLLGKTFWTRRNATMTVCIEISNTWDR